MALGIAVNSGVRLGALVSVGEGVMLAVELGKGVKVRVGVGVARCGAIGDGGLRGRIVPLLVAIEAAWN